MAQGAAGNFQVITHLPGNPQLPVLPNPADPKTGLDDPFAILASITQLQFPDSVLAVLGAGPGVANGFAQVYLNGIGGTPNPVDFGNITANKQLTVTVHNTYRFPVSITAVDVSAVSGVTVLSPGLPIAVPSFDSIVFTFEAALLGDATFDAAVEFTHDLGSFSIRMIGRRVILFNTVPQRPIQEQVTFGTNVMKTQDGSEQVMSWRTTPRSRIAYHIRFTDDIERSTLVSSRVLRQSPESPRWRPPRAHRR